MEGCSKVACTKEMARMNFNSCSPIGLFRACPVRSSSKSVPRGVVLPPESPLLSLPPPAAGAMEVTCATLLLSTPQEASVPDDKRRGTLVASPDEWEWTRAGDVDPTLALSTSEIKRAYAGRPAPPA